MVMAFKNGEVQDRYLWGAKQDELLCKNNEWALGDHLNTVRDVISADGMVRKHLEYNAFGELQGEPGEDVEFAYTGKLYDSATSLQWNINRWYDPKDANLYRYVRNSSFNAIDLLTVVLRTEPLVKN